MVILGGLEVVAAGYLIHKHQQNKKDKQRLAEEAAYLEESQYRIFPPDRPASSAGHRRRRSHSRESSGRHTHERRERRDRHDRTHSEDRKYTHNSPSRRDNGRPSKSQINVSLPQQQPPMPVYHTQVPVPVITQPFPPPPQAPSAMRPPPPPAYNTIPTANSNPPQDMKYGWTDEPAGPSQQPQQDPDFPPTGWPAHWSQSQTPPTLAPRAETSSGRRHERRARTPEPHTSRVRFDVPGSGSSVRSSSRSPPPSYRG